MARQKKKPEKPKKVRANKVQVAKRVEEVLRIRLDGAEFWDVREYVREKEALAGSAWELGPDEEPLSDQQLWRYLQKATKAMEAESSRSRGKLIRLGLARRRNLYAKALLSADYRTALACLRDHDELRGLYPGKKHEISGPAGGPIKTETKHDVAADLAPYAAAIAAFVAGSAGALPPNGSAQPLDAPSPDGQAGPVPPA